MPQRPPSRVRMPAALRWLVIDLTPHCPRGAVAGPGQPKDQPFRLGLKGIDLQGFLRAVAALLAGDNAVANRRQAPFQNPCRAFSFMARRVCLAFSLDWYSPNSAMIWRLILLMGSSPSSWVIDTS